MRGHRKNYKINGNKQINRLQNLTNNCYILYYKNALSTNNYFIGIEINTKIVRII